jgi:hypothetical protein
LVLAKRVDLLKAMTTSCQNETPDSQVTLADLCLNPQQIPGLISCLLIQPAADRGSFITTILSSVDAELANFDLREILRSDPVPIAAEILKNGWNPSGGVVEEVSSSDSRGVML